jgi:acyl dehydratase
VADDHLIKGKITDRDVELMRKRIGYPNPTVRSGTVKLPWNTVATPDAIRHWAEGYGDGNPLFVDPAYGPTTRWGSQIAPPGFEGTMGYNRSQEIPKELDRETRVALRGVQLYHSGSENRWYRPIVPGDELYRSQWVDSCEPKDSSFGGRSAIVTNALATWDNDEQVTSTGKTWFVHAERKKAKKTDKYAKDEPAQYTDEDLEKIEAAYDAEFVRGADTLHLEDVKVGEQLPVMVKGAMTITDQINMYQGGGWFGYGNPAFRLGFENRKKLRGFYTRNEFNAWDVVQRVHWDKNLANEVGVPLIYDIGPMRAAWASQYCSNYAGDNGFVHYLRYEFRRFNYFGDTTWIRGTVTDARVDETLGPVVGIDIRGENQRGQENLSGSAQILVSSREHGPVVLPTPPPMPEYRS